MLIMSKLTIYFKLFCLSNNPYGDRLRKFFQIIKLKTKYPLSNQKVL